VLGVDGELVLQQPVALVAALGVAGVERPELANPDRGPGGPHELGPLQARPLDLGPVDVHALGLARIGTAEDETRQRVVVRGVHRVLVQRRALENAEVGGVPVAV
jgi:hypothetical protein